MELSQQFSLRQSFGEIGSHPDFSIIETEEPDSFVILSSAENEPERRRFPFGPFIFPKPR